MRRGEAWKNELIEFLFRVEAKITDEWDVGWTRFYTPAEFRAEIDTLIENLRSGEDGCLKKITLFFAPTNALQEHAACNGWSEEYLAISEKIDALCW